ncbi:C2H2-type domain-containing protein [Durusdinium trenchii]|uniref:C2H2-type domain-containing protein n=1 Tax=Durusdinium trenchii TaxID=1381693 RepID=A0ABP0K487_9DINO
MATSMALYQDKFVEIYADHIKIKSYYAPVFRSKRINIGKECRVSFATDEELGFTKVDRKGWGMALNNVWWALDMRREFIFGGPKHPGIVITVGRDTFRKGFSVEDGEAAVKVLEGADLRSAVTRLEARMHALEGQNLRSDRRAAELAGLTQVFRAMGPALTEEQRALLIRLDRLEDGHLGDTIWRMVPEDRLGRLEQEHRTLALELRLTASVAEEAQQKQQQRIRSLEESMGARLRKLEHGGGEMQAETDPSGRSWWPEVSKSRANDEAKDVSRVCDSLEAKLCGLTASVEEIQKQLVSPAVMGGKGLPAQLERSLHQGLLIDVGAHYGQSSAAILKVLGEASSYDLECQPQVQLDSLRMMLFEPNPRNCKVLRKQVQKWQRPGPGLGDEKQPVSLLRRHPNATLQTEVDVVTLDWYLQWEDFEGEIFLLKIDAEGFDPLVLRGAKELLRKHRVRYLIFEVDRVWASAGHGIRLDQVFCACEFDPELFAIYLSYTDPAQRPAVLYAAVELQQSSLPPAKPWRRVAEQFRHGLGEMGDVRVLRCQFRCFNRGLASKGGDEETVTVFANVWDSEFHVFLTPLPRQLEQLEHFCLDLRETLEDWLVLV